MTEDEKTKDCKRCNGRGRYADPSVDPLVQMVCESCDGSGKVPADAPDEEPVQEAKQVPFGSG